MRRPIADASTLKHADLRGEFYCTICSEVFLHRASLNRHRVRHQVAQFCVDCGFVAGSLLQMKEHLKGVHLVEKVHSCVECQASFARKSDLNHHVNTRAMQLEAGINCPSKFNRPTPPPDTITPSDAPCSSGAVSVTDISTDLAPSTSGAILSVTDITDITGSTPSTSTSPPGATPITPTGHGAPMPLSVIVNTDKKKKAAYIPKVYHQKNLSSFKVLIEKLRKRAGHDEDKEN